MEAESFERDPDFEETCLAAIEKVEEALEVKSKKGSKDKPDSDDGDDDDGDDDEVDGEDLLSELSGLDESVREVIYNGSKFKGVVISEVDK